MNSSSSQPGFSPAESRGPQVSQAPVLQAVSKERGWVQRHPVLTTISIGVTAFVYWKSRQQILFPTFNRYIHQGLRSPEFRNVISIPGDRKAIEAANEVVKRMEQKGQICGLFKYLKILESVRRRPIIREEILRGRVKVNSRMLEEIYKPVRKLANVYATKMWDEIETRRIVRARNEMAERKKENQKVKFKK